MDRTNINRLLVYKTNGNIVDVTDNLTAQQIIDLTNLLNP